MIIIMRLHHISGKKIKWVMKTADQIESAILKKKRIKVWTYDSIFITYTGIPYISKENFLVLERPEGPKILDLGWVARDFDGHLFCYEERPLRFDTLLIWIGKGRFKMQLPMEMLPLLTWDDRPKKYNIRIYATKISEGNGTGKI